MKARANQRLKPRNFIEKRLIRGVVLYPRYGKSGESSRKTSNLFGKRRLTTPIRQTRRYGVMMNREKMDMLTAGKNGRRKTRIVVGHYKKNGAVSWLFQGLEKRICRASAEVFRAVNDGDTIPPGQRPRREKTAHPM